MAMNLRAIVIIILVVLAIVYGIWWYINSRPIIKEDKHKCKDCKCK